MNTMTTDPNAPKVNQDQEAIKEQANAQESASQDQAMETEAKEGAEG